MTTASRRTLAAWAVRFLEHREALGLAPATLELDDRHVTAFLAWARERHLQPAELTPACVSAYVDTIYEHRTRAGRRRGELYRALSVVAILRSLRVFFRFLVEQDVLLLDPLADVTGPRTSVILGRGLFSSAEICRVMAVLGGDAALMVRDRAIFGLLYSTGMRRGELVALDVGDYDRIERTVWIRCGKGRKGRVAPVGSQTATDLDRYLTQSRPELVGHRPDSLALFVTIAGRRVSPDLVSVVLNAAERRAGIRPRRGTHAVRHSFATHMLRGGANLRVLQEFLGHESLGSTAPYLDLDLADLRAMLERAHPRESDPC